ncbi:DNA cytosine methyltransferase [Pseudomonas syringae pv. syringae]|nr:DNA cytosine methyltransferase [Pseudomonas syringae]MCF5551930.1 DNA cytosine methyltransferase [Pseudomonas syringae]MCH5497994.1 DNA cytosine methyltransferase [Pseudomonas syringae pv. syringae]MCH5523984.1 DNA cytosine methyltransferase [Pseudomonas syringae pv. syringae]MCH5559074.1 DNA cytosine methyltransferase [Pseudomonas syringae pv. syringae]MCH5564130.1 DNA cytosine methyltransferase [Pseudomonas syringae pv. syringae]
MFDDQRYPPLTHGSVCSGIEAATAAWHPLGMEPVWFAEIEPFPSAVLAHHYPRTPNLGDMTRLASQVLAGKIDAPDVLVGGTPCQAFSVAGMRQGMLDPRGALTIKYVELADAVDHVRTSRNQPESIIVWENVPGVLSDKGNAFGCFLGALAGEDCELQPPGKRWQDAGCVYGPKRTIAWRILDAQYFGLAQRRRRVFVVASAREGFDPTAVLFERESLRRDNPPSRESRQDVTGTLSSRSTGGGGLGTDFDLAGGLQAVDVCPTLRAGGNSTGGDRPPGTDVDTADSLIVVHGTQDPCVMHGLAHALGRNSGQENAVFCRDVAQTVTSNYGKQLDNTDSALGPNIVAVTLRGREGGGTAELGEDIAGCLRASSGGGDKPHALIPRAFAENSRSEIRFEDGDGGITGALSTGGGKPGQGTPSIQTGSSVRRLTPRECERLQGFPDNYTLIPWRNKPAAECPDGPRYKAIGNSKAVPVVRWIGMRILEQL